MTIKHAKELRKGDRVEWTWLHPQERDREFGNVTGAGERAFSVSWEDFPAEDSVFFFDEPSRIENVEIANHDTTYEPLEHSP